MGSVSFERDGRYGLSFSCGSFGMLCELAVLYGYQLELVTMMGDEEASQQLNHVDAVVARGLAAALADALDDIPNHQCPPTTLHQACGLPSRNANGKYEKVHPLEFWAGSKKKVIQLAIEFCEQGEFNVFIDG